MKKYIQNQKGFTLVELVVYIALISVVLGFFVTSFSLISQARARNVILSIVEQEGLQISQVLTHTIRNGGSTTPQSAFNVVNGRLSIAESGISNYLNSNYTTVTDLSFQNLSQSGKPSAIRFKFTIANSSSLSQRYQYSKTFYGSEVVYSN